MTQQTGDISSALHGLHFAGPVTRTHYLLKQLRDVGITGKKVDILCVSMGICFSSTKLTSPQVCRRSPGSSPN